MTAIAVPLTGLPAATVPHLPAELREDLAYALSADAAMAVHRSGGELYFAVGEGDDRTTAEALRADALPSDAEVGVIEEVDGQRETLVALRDRSDAASVAILDPITPFIARRHLDSAAMRLRREDVTIGPTPTGGWYFLGTRLETDELPDAIDGDVAHVVDTSVDADRTVGYLPILPAVGGETDLEQVGALLAAMRRSGRAVGPYTTAWFERRDGATDTS